MWHGGQKEMEHRLYGSDNIRDGSNQVFALAKVWNWNIVFKTITEIPSMDIQGTHNQQK